MGDVINHGVVNVFIVQDINTFVVTRYYVSLNVYDLAIFAMYTHLPRSDVT